MRSGKLRARVCRHALRTHSCRLLLQEESIYGSVRRSRVFFGAFLAVTKFCPQSDIYSGRRIVEVLDTNSFHFVSLCSEDSVEIREPYCFGEGWRW